MENIHLKEPDLNLSRVALGTWAIGGWMWGGTDEQAAVDAVRAAVDMGIRVVDTAPVYGFGRSEEIVGRALKGIDRDKVVVATKCGLDWNEKGPFRNASKERISKEIEDSLRRLNVDVIDIYQIHWPDPLTPMQETAETMAELLRTEKIRAVGVSNFNQGQMESFMADAPLHLCQPPFNLFERRATEELIPFGRERNIALMTYGALCRGLLTGKFDQNASFEGDDLRQVDPKFQPPRFRHYLEAVSKLDDFAREKYDRRVIHLAVRWILDKGVDVAIWGARRPDQLEPIEQVFDWRLDPEDIDSVEKIVVDTVADPVGPEFMAPPDRNGNTTP